MQLLEKEKENKHRVVFLICGRTYFSYIQIITCRNGAESERVPM